MNAADGYLPRSRLQALFDCLIAAGYQCIGPKVREQALVYERLSSAADLPYGVQLEQEPGSVRLTHHDSARCFAWANGPQAVKPYLFAPRETVWRVRRDADGHLHFKSENLRPERLAIIGVRACDLAALRLQDQHFLETTEIDPHYRDRRAELFIIAVHCDHPAATCFCSATGDGPAANSGYDLALTELDEGYLVRAGSEAGHELVAKLALVPAIASQYQQEGEQLEQATQAQVRSLPSTDLRYPLAQALEHPRWDEVATRCLACGNCTQVCPTCFCHALNTTSDLTGTDAECTREWDSCFTAGHAYMHGYHARPDIRSRYRQWLTHKLSSWHDQYGRSGCVGCGRCIAWCPVGIDITEEVGALCGTETTT